MSRNQEVLKAKELPHMCNCSIPGRSFSQSGFFCLKKETKMNIEHYYLNPDNLRLLGNNIHNSRDSHNENIITCAEKLGISYQELDKIERGDVKSIDIPLVLKFAQLYNEKICFYIGDDYGF